MSLSGVSFLAVAGIGFSGVFAVSMGQVFGAPAANASNLSAHVVTVILLAIVSVAIRRSGSAWQLAHLSVVFMLATVLVADSISSVSLLALSLPLSLFGAIAVALVLASQSPLGGSEELSSRIFDSENRIGVAGVDTMRALRGLHSAALIIDGETQSHGHAVADLAARLGASIGMPPSEVNAVYWAALLHDVGKVSVERSVLKKPSQLSADEFEAVKGHAAMGADLVRSIGDGPLLRSVAAMILHHHERWDGRGYPSGRGRDEIPLGARIIAITDVFEALICDRPYRSAMSTESAMQIIADGAGSHFDPDLVGVFLWMLSEGLTCDMGVAGKPGETAVASNREDAATSVGRNGSVRFGHWQEDAALGSAVITSTMA